MNTIKDVAKLAGTSYATVSHVINGTKVVLPETQQRVEAAIAQLGYQPNAAARSLKTRETRILAMLVPNVINPFFAELARGIEDQCRSAGYSVFLCNCDDNADRYLDYLKTLTSHRVDGILLATATGEQGPIRNWNRRDMPVVMVDRRQPGLATDLVCIDHAYGARLAVEHLLSLGHRRIACVTGPAHLEVSQARLNGWREALTAAGIEPDMADVFAGDFSVASGYQAGLQLLGQRTFSGVFVSNDLMAMGMLRAASERGLSVPGDVSVIGFDAVETGAYTTPALSSIGVSIRQLGEQAAAALIRRIQQPDMPLQILQLVPSLVLRESCAPYPATAT